AAHEESERLNRLKSDFVSIVSHEFRTALTGIQGFSEMIRDEDLALDEVKEYAGDINHSAQRVNRMISEMLDLDRMESGRMSMHRERVALASVIAEVVGLLRPAAPKHVVSVQVDASLPRLVADRDKLVQVVTNLVSNAIKYSPNGGDIALRCSAAGEAIHLS